MPNGVDGLNLTELNLNQNQISSLSASLAECPRLKTLRLEENCLGLDALPTDLVNNQRRLVGCLSRSDLGNNESSTLDRNRITD